MASLKKANKFSPLEAALLALVPKDGTKIDSTALVGKYYPAGAVPLNGQQLVIGRMRAIGRKAERNDETWRVRKSPRAGPNPISFWIEVIRK